MKMALPLIISLAVVWFVWNVFRYMIAGGEDEKTKAKKEMIWGIVALFVMVSVWGLVGILQATFVPVNPVPPPAPPLLIQ